MKRTTSIILACAALAALFVGAGHAFAAPPAQAAGWQAAYYANPDLAGEPAYVQTDPAIDFDWGMGGPPGLGNDYFSVRWTTTLSLDAGTYRFNATSDDGIRVWVDGLLLVDTWSVHPLQSAAFEYTVDGGEHPVVVEYFEAQEGASVEFKWDNLGDPQPVAPTGPVTSPVVNYPDVFTIVDDTDPGFSMSFDDGGWYSSPAGFNDESRYRLNVTNRANAYQWAEWNPGDLPAGYYQVMVYIPYEHATTHNATYRIRHGGGMAEVPVDQFAQRGQWFTLGRFNFTEGVEEYVSLDNVTGERLGYNDVAYDAVAFVRIDTQLWAGYTVEPRDYDRSINLLLGIDVAGDDGVTGDNGDIQDFYDQLEEILEDLDSGRLDDVLFEDLPSGTIEQLLMLLTP
jgi:hypothetical protein